MNGLLDRVATILQRRFMLVSFLPVLIFVGSLGLLVLVATGNGKQALDWWARLSGSLQIILVLSAIAAVWLLGGFVDSQLRNLIQLFEGYPLSKVAPRLYERATAWHSARRTILTLSENDPRYSRAARAIGRRGMRPTQRFAEEAFALYPEDDRIILPTQLGNVLRAAEDYAEVRYGVDYLIVWPRLSHMCSERFVEELEEARAKLEFLLVVSALSGLFAFVGGSVLLVVNGSPLLFAAVVLAGFGLARLAYSSSVHAAVEVGEKMRASMDLFRLDLLRQLRYAEPRDLKEERRNWREFDNLLRGGEDRPSEYVPLTPAPNEPSPTNPAN